MDRWPKDFPNSQPPLDTPLDKVLPNRGPMPSSTHQGDRQWHLPPGSLHNFLDQPHPPGGRQNRQEKCSPTAYRPNPKVQARHYPGMSWPWVLGWWEGTAVLEHIECLLQRADSTTLRNNQPTTYIKIQIAIQAKWGDRGICFIGRNKKKARRRTKWHEDSQSTQERGQSNGLRDDQKTQEANGVTEQEVTRSFF